jgi:hypothetical protein
MEENKQTTVQAFQEGVPSVFGFLISDYKFSLTKEEDWLFEGQTEYAVIEIFLDRGSVFVGLRPINPKDRYLPEPLRRAGKTPVVLIAQCLDPNLHFKLKLDIKPEEIRGELEKYAELLQRYCSRMLRGDFAEWPTVQSCLEKQSKLFSNH